MQYYFLIGFSRINNLENFTYYINKIRTVRDKPPQGGQSNQAKMGNSNETISNRMTQEQTLKIMKTGVNIYLTGSAGSGKTYLLNQYISYLYDHNIAVAVTASTGIAATCQE